MVLRLSYLILVSAFVAGAAQEGSCLYERITGERPTAFTEYFLQHSIRDLDGDGQPEVLIMNREKGRCSGLSCPIHIAAFRNGDWESIGEAFGARFLVQDDPQTEGWNQINVPATVGPRASVTRLTYDEGIDRYVETLPPQVEPVQMEPARPIFEASGWPVDDLLARDLGSRSLFMRSVATKGDDLLLGTADLNGDDEDEYFLYVSNPGVCGDAGCPLLVYSSFDDGPILQLTTEGVFGVAAEQRPGDLRDVFIRRGGKIHELKWNADLQEYEIEN